MRTVPGPSARGAEICPLARGKPVQFGKDSERDFFKESVFEQFLGMWCLQLEDKTGDSRESQNGKFDHVA